MNLPKGLLTNQFLCIRILAALSLLSKMILAVRKILCQEAPPKGEESMPVKIFQPSKHKEEIKQLLRDGISVEECATRFPLSERTIYRYLREVQDEKSGKVVEDKITSTQKVVTHPVDLAVVTTRTPGPIVFRMGGNEIDMNPGDLYDAWRYCEDIKRIEPSIDDDFTVMLKVAAKNLWEHFSHREASRAGVNLELVKEE